MHALIALIVAFVVISFLVLVHEAGHLVAAKRAGVEVTVFSVGFGRRLWGRTRGGTEYRVSLLPLGGYCQFAVDKNPDGSEGTGSLYGKTSWWRMTSVLLSGVAVNIVVSWVFMLFAQLARGQDFLDSFVGSFIAFGRMIFLVTTSIPAGMASTFAFHGSDEALVGPIGVADLGSKMVSSLPILFLLISLLSMGLAVLNLLPLPVLDGGQWLMTSFEYARGRALSFRAVMAAKSVSFALIIMLVVAVTANDIIRLF
jgi:regulator of sigma E protease